MSRDLVGLHSPGWATQGPEAHPARNGAAFSRRPMKDASGASQMDATTQVTSLHGVSMLEATQYPMEANVCLALLHEPGGDNEWALVNVAIGAEVNLHGEPSLAAAQAAREAGSAPNSVLAAALSLIGPRRAEGARRAAQVLIERFAAAGLEDAQDESFDLKLVGVDRGTELLLSDQPDPKAEAMLAGFERRGAKSVFVRYLESLGGHPRADAVLAALTTTLAWAPLMQGKISRLTAESLPWWMRLFGALIGASAAASRHEPGRFHGLPNQEILDSRSLTEVAYLTLLGENPQPSDLLAFRVLLGLLLSNGPGTISAQGAKGAVSADGPENPARVQLNKATVGFLTHTGYAHGGNGYDGIEFLIQQFSGAGLSDPADPDHGLDLRALAALYATEYARYRSQRKSAGPAATRKIPGVNHPVFKDRSVNHDPREVFVHDLFVRRGEYNVFHEYYRALVQALFDAGASRNVYCVNVDAVIAALLLKLTWRRYLAGDMPVEVLQTTAFSLFLYARMLGCAAEVDDHLNRGRDMDTRTPASRCEFVA